MERALSVLSLKGFAPRNVSHMAVKAKYSSSVLQSSECFPTSTDLQVSKYNLGSLPLTTQCCVNKLL